MEENQKVISAFFWKFLERSGNQIASFIVTLFLARMLTPSDYGLVALIVVFTSIASTFVQGGFNTALIQAKKLNEDDYSSVMWFSFLIAVVLYGVLFYIAPIISEFYSSPDLKPIMRCLSLILFPAALNSIQVANVTRKLHFKVLTIANTLALVSSSVVGILLAFLGSGPWALVWQQLLNQIVVCVALFSLTRWLPKGTFKWSSIKRLVPFGSKVLASSLMVSIFLNLRTLIIGKMYSAKSLGFFNRGKTFPQTFMESINGTVQAVLLPIYAKKQDTPERVISMLRETIRTVSFITFPMSFGLACIATPLVQLLLTDKWLACVPFVQIFSIGYLFNPSQTASTQAYNALGKSSYSLTVESIRKTTEMVLLLISMKFGVMAIAISTLVNGVVGTAITIGMNARKLGYSTIDQIKDLLPASGISMIMSVVIILIGRYVDNPLLSLIVQFIMGLVVYVVIAGILRVKSFNLIKQFVLKNAK